MIRRWLARSSRVKEDIIRISDKRLHRFTLRILMAVVAITALVVWLEVMRERRADHLKWADYFAGLRFMTMMEMEKHHHYLAEIDEGRASPDMYTEEVRWEWAVEVETVAWHNRCVAFYDRKAARPWEALGSVPPEPAIFEVAAHRPRPTADELAERFKKSRRK